MANEEVLTFPDINDAFEDAIDLPIVCTNYINILNNAGTFYCNQYGNKLFEFIECDKKISLLEKEFNEVKSFLRHWSEQHSVKATITIRKKNFIGFNSKIRLFLSSGIDLDAIRDLLGFKIVLLTSSKDNLETIKLCYELMNDLLNFISMERHGLLLNAESRLGKALDNDSKIAKKLFLCDKSFLLPEFEEKVKNYILSPKDSGYQGLHAYAKIPSKLGFEIQVKTLAMDIYGESIHELHKKQRYKNFKIALDYNKIHVSGVVFDEKNYLVCDKCGLFNSINPCNLI